MQFLNRRAVAAYTLIFGLVVMMSGCGGGGQSEADKKAAVTVTQVVISPSPSISMTPGQVVPLFAAALNANGSQIFSETIGFSSSAQNDPNHPIQIGSANGNTLLCAGTWDNTSNPVVCNPLPLSSVPATSNITASAGSVTSPTVVASVHLPITSVVVNPPAPACVTEKGTQVFTAQAFNGATDITTTVGTFNWLSQNANVATIPANGDTGQTSQATATAVHPGQTNIVASIGSVSPISSTPAVFTQCLVNSIAVSVGSPDITKNPPEDASHFTVATGSTRALTVVVKDTAGTTLTTLPALTWNTSQLAIAGVNGQGTVNGVAPGVVGISASCVPNNCNIGTNTTVTSNSVTGTVTGTPGTSATAYVTCKSPGTPAPNACNTGTDAAPQVKLFPISGTTLGTAITLPHVPNSMMINQQNSKLYIGSTPAGSDTSAGLMVVDTNTNSFSATVANAPGTVLAVAPNGNAVVTSNGSDVFLYNGNTVTTLLNGTTHVTGAVAAGFSPDSTKLLVSTSGSELWFEAAGATPNFISALAPASSVTWFPSGRFGAVSRSGGTDYIDQNPDQTPGSVGKPVFDGNQTCGGLTAPLPTVDALGFDEILSADPAGTMCVLTTAPASTTFGVGAFSATQLLVSPYGTHAYLIGGGTSIQDYTVGTTTLTPIALTGNPTVTTGGITPNHTIFVGASDGKVHQFAFAGNVPTGAVTETIIDPTIPPDLVVTKR